MKNVSENDKWSYSVMDCGIWMSEWTIVIVYSTLIFISIVESHKA